MPELKALVAREWGLLKRPALGGLLLLTLGVAFLFVMCRVPDRYRLLDEPNLLRIVMLPGPALLGLLLSYVSFAQEMRAGTWDGLLLLPCSRRLVLFAKVAVGLAALLLATAIPMVALRATLAALPATGGPVLTTAELLRHSLLGRALALGLVAYLSGANAAFLARAHRGAFLLPAGAAVVGLLALHDESPSLDPICTTGILLLVALLWLGLLAAAMAHHGRAPAGRFLAARALLAMPVALVVLHLVGLLAHGLYLEAPEQAAEDDGEEALQDGISTAGHIVRARDHRVFLAMYSAKKLEEVDPPGDRYWRPDFSGSKLQLFLRKDAPTFLAYDVSTGRFLGCVGRDGLRPSGCEPFDSAPRVLRSTSEGAFFFTSSAAFVFEEETRSVQEIHRGPIRAFTTLSVGEGDGLALQSGADLHLWGDEPDTTGVESPEDESEEPDEPEPSRPSPPAQGPAGKETVCPGAAALGDITGVAARDSFVAVSTVDPASGQETLVVCRDGAVSERKTLALEVLPDAPDDDGRERLRAAVLGPLLSEGASLLGVTWNRWHTPRPFTATRPTTYLVALAGALVVTALLGLRRRRAPVSGLLLVAACASLLGPAYLAAYLILLWRRSWSGALGT